MNSPGIASVYTADARVALLSVQFMDVPSECDLPSSSSAFDPLLFEKLVMGMPEPTASAQEAIVLSEVSTMIPREMSQQEIEEQILCYEQNFGMSSEEFVQRMQDGTVPDTFETMDWMILLRYR